MLTMHTFINITSTTNCDWYIQIYFNINCELFSFIVDVLHLLSITHNIVMFLNKQFLLYKIFWLVKK